MNDGENSAGHRRNRRDRRRNRPTALARGWRVKALNRTLPKARQRSRGSRATRWTRAPSPTPQGRRRHRARGEPGLLSQLARLAIPMLANTIAAAVAERALIVFPGNLYNYGPDAWPTIREDSPSTRSRRKAPCASRWKRC